MLYLRRFREPGQVGAERVTPGEARQPLVARPYARAGAGATTPFVVEQVVGDVVWHVEVGPAGAGLRPGAPVTESAACSGMVDPY